MGKTMSEGRNFNVHAVRPAYHESELLIHWNTAALHVITLQGLEWQRARKVACLVNGPGPSFVDLCATDGGWGVEKIEEAFCSHRV
jgi:hypothetical protein